MNEQKYLLFTSISKYDKISKKDIKKMETDLREEIKDTCLFKFELMRHYLSEILRNRKNLETVFREIWAIDLWRIDYCYDFEPDDIFISAERNIFLTRHDLLLVLRKIISSGEDYTYKIHESLISLLDKNVNIVKEEFQNWN